MEKKREITPVLKRMEVGAVELWPIDRTLSVKAVASTLATVFDCKYITRVNKDQKVIEVRRVK